MFVKAATLGAAIALSAAVALAWFSRDAPSRPNLALDACGIERWPIKTMADPDAGRITFTPKLTTVRGMRQRKRPEHLGHARIAPVELTTYRIEADLRSASREEDLDIHLVIADEGTQGLSTMIVELPAPACTVGAFGHEAMQRARRAFEQACGLPSKKGWNLDGRATIVGVGFWDFIHGQRGVARNGIELHPLTGFRNASCRRQPRS